MTPCYTTSWDLTGLTLAVLSLTSSTPVAFGLAGVLGSMQIVVAQNAIVTVQTYTSARYRGRVLGLYATVLHGTSPIGAVVAGGIGELTGVRGSMTAASLVLLIVRFVSIAYARRPRTA